MDIQKEVENKLTAFWQKGYNAGFVKMDSLTAISEGDKMAQEILSLIRQEVSKAIPKEKDVMYSGLDVYKHQQVVCLDKVSDWGKKVGYNQALSDIQSALQKKGLL